jgi:hypothetical protein
LGGYPIAHGAGAVGGVDLIPVEFPQMAGLSGSQPGDLSFVGENPPL